MFRIFNVLLLVTAKKKKKEAIKGLMSVMNKLYIVADKINEQETSINRNIYVCVYI